jgi:EmrB/QacA subfamily drug resistance transporter
MTHTRIISLIVAVALFMENMDSTVIATALPAIAADIGTNPLALKLAVTSYLLSLAIFIPASGWVADRFGTRTIFRLAIAIFMLGSIGCALSHSLTDFVMARMVQGVGGAMMTPVGRLILLRSIDRRALLGAMAWVTMPALIGPMVGPPVGGFITTYASWHWIFIINIPIGILGIILATRYIDEIRAEKQAPFDFLGMTLAGLGLGGVAFGLSVAGLDLLPLAPVLALSAIGVLFLVLYVRHAKRTPSPVLDLALLSIPSFRATITGGFLFRLGIGAWPFLMPLMLQLGLKMSPFQSGLITFARLVRRAADEACHRAFAQSVRLQEYSGAECGDQRRFPRRLRALQRHHAGLGHVRYSHPRRLFPLAGIHQHQYAGLCRCAAAAHELSDGDRERAAAGVRVLRRRGRSAACGTDQPLQRQFHLDHR